jgi:ribosome-associated protein
VRARLVELIARALERPKRRVPTKPTLGSKKRRLDGKTRRGNVKTLRGKVRRDD